MAPVRSRERIGDAIQRGMMESVGGEIELSGERVRGVLDEALTALEKYSRGLNEWGMEREVWADCPQCKEPVRVGYIQPKDLAAVATASVRVMDDLYRLSEFASGRADSRSESVGASAMLEMLTNEQMEQVLEWVRVNKMKRVGKAAEEV